MGELDDVQLLSDHPLRTDMKRTCMDPGEEGAPRVSDSSPLHSDFITVGLLYNADMF